VLEEVEELCFVIVADDERHLRHGGQCVGVALRITPGDDHPRAWIALSGHADELARIRLGLRRDGTGVNHIDIRRLIEIHDVVLVPVEHALQRLSLIGIELTPEGEKRHAPSHTSPSQLPQSLTPPVLPLRTGEGRCGRQRPARVSLRQSREKILASQADRPLVAFRRRSISATRVALTWGRLPDRRAPDALRWPPPPKTSATARTSKSCLARRLTRRCPGSCSRRNSATSTPCSDTA